MQNFKIEHLLKLLYFSLFLKLGMGLNAGYSWTPWSTDQGTPPAGVYAGNDEEGSPIYIGRAYHNGNELPAKVIPSKRAAYVSHDNKDTFKSHFEVLSGQGFTWEHSSHGHVPHGAVLCGHSKSGEPLYIGRARREGSLNLGIINRSQGGLYVSVDGVERKCIHYDVLVGPQTSYWLHHAAAAPIPPGATLAGYDSDNFPIYVGRAYHERDQLPAKVIPSKQIAYVTHNGQEIPKDTFDVLYNENVAWIPSGLGSIPPNAVLGGHTSDDERLYIGRAHYMGSLLPGKVDPIQQTLYISYGGNEIALKNYELLVEN